MSEDNIKVILHRLDQLDARLCEIHEEVKRTNGRVTELEMESAVDRGKDEAKKTQATVVTSVLSGGILAGMVWFVTQAI